MCRIMIAGTGSGCGKTTVTCGLLGALKNMNKKVISFKVGPDYIDPMFHKKVTCIESRNLDVFLMGDENVKYSLSNYTKDKDIAIIESAMGLYDGIGSENYCSGNHMSILTETPVILVVNAKGKSRSVCAEIHGYMNYDKNNIRGVILNNIQESMYLFYKNMIESNVKVPIIGFMTSIIEAQVQSRHLGLVTADEITEIKNKLELLAKSAAKNIDISKLISIAQSAKEIKLEKIYIKENKSKYNPTIYIAKDDAFCFFYDDNHHILESLGAIIKFFSPINDKELPDDADGLILWGGYPELHAYKLEQNISMKESIYKKIKDGLPTYAECGGFMYLQNSITDLENKKYSMLGVIDGEVIMTKKLQNFGYITLEANRDSQFCLKGMKINAHSFHHSISTNEGTYFTAIKKSSGKCYECSVVQKNVFGGYPHMHFYSNMHIPTNFINLCSEYRKEVENEIYRKPARN